MKTIFLASILLLCLLPQPSQQAISTLAPGLTLEHVLAADKENVLFTVTSNTVGWVAIGFGGHTMKEVNDYVVVSFNQATAIAQNYFGYPEVKPDTMTSVLSVAAQSARTATSTKVTFLRKLKPVDTNDFELKVGVEAKIIWAQGATDKFEKHTNKGTGTIKIEAATGNSVLLSAFAVAIASLLIIF